MAPQERVSSSELEQIVTHGREERHIEYKSSMNWQDTGTKLKVVKCCLAMSNIQDGGWMVFGVERSEAGAYEPAGMRDAHADSFNQDGVQEYVNEFADPHIEPKVFQADYEGKRFVVIRIHQFDRLPIICRKDAPEKLKKGLVFIRPRRKIESAPVRNEKELREILDLAVNIQVQRKLARMVEWGAIRFRGPAEDEHTVAFHSERKDLEEDG